jgi:hypothetical protein
MKTTVKKALASTAFIASMFLANGSVVCASNGSSGSNIRILNNAQSLIQGIAITIIVIAFLIFAIKDIKGLFDGSGGLKGLIGKTVIAIVAIAIVVFATNFGKIGKSVNDKTQNGVTNAVDSISNDLGK